MIGRGIDHTIAHYESAIDRYKSSANPLLLSFVNQMERTLKGLYGIRGKL